MTRTPPKRNGNSVSALLEDARRRLVETGTRSRLIHVNRTSKRSNTLNIINERADDVFEILRVKSRKMKFAALGRDQEEDQAQDELSLALAEDDVFDERRYKDQYLETPLTSDGLQKRLLRLARDSRTAEEEQGVNILYLAMGFLSWFEDKNSAVEREAPLLLLPVELIRNNRSSTYEVKCRDDDVVTNLPLQERLKTDFGIDLPDVDDTEQWVPSDNFEQVRKAVSGHPRWEIDQDGMQLGFFSFSKLLMLRDLDPENWPGSSLVNNELVQKLLVDGFSSESPLFADGDHLDDLLEPADIMHVVDADASQAKVIEEVRAERNIVVQGPPGTGKSQTITNILAAAVHDGRTAVFVAEKMAALEVVHKRMVKVGLQDLCLELHSRRANKKTMLMELARTLKNGRSVPDLPKPPDKLKASRDGLNRIADLLHKSVPDRDYSPFEAMASIVELSGRDVQPPSLSVEALDRLTNSERDQLAESVEAYVEALTSAGAKSEHPFFGTRNLELQPTDLQRLETEIHAATDSIDALTAALNNVAELTELEFGRSVNSADAVVAILRHIQDAPPDAGDHLSILFPSDERAREALALGEDWQSSKKALSETFSHSAWDHPVDDLRRHLANGAESLLSRVFGKYRGSSSELATLLKGALPRSPAGRVDLVDHLIDIQTKQNLFGEDADHLREALGGAWRGERTNFAALRASAEWLHEITEESPSLSEDQIRKALDNLADGGIDRGTLTSLVGAVRRDVSAPLGRLDLRLSEETEGFEHLGLPSLKGRLVEIQSDRSRYSEWVNLATLSARLSETLLTELVERLDEKTIAPAAAVDEFCYATAEARWRYARACLPALNDLPQLDRHSLVRVFQKLEKSRIKDVQNLIRANHLDQLPQGASGEMGFLRGEIAKKRRHRSIRKIMEAAGSIVQRIKPVFLMSPISVAQFLPPESVKFDILVIDEASQVRPEDALGAIARVKNIVVVGDQKQLPPTSFFSRLTDNVDDDDDDEGEDGAPVPAAKAVEMESILTLCEARGLRQSMLEWHYRSRDPSLITVSNKEFYEDRLILPPSPLSLDDNFGLKFRRVQGVYSSESRGGGRPGTNRIEAEAVAGALADHARKWPNFSVGVVAFSRAQADMIMQVLELARRSDDITDRYLREGNAEDVFIKNIENVQGDERDVILISVGYGPNELNSRLANMNFGPVNAEGGERRLNVLFTRARMRCEVFASFEPSEIDLNRTKKDGPRVLKRFLEFAKSGVIDERIATGKGADSPFEEDVARVVASLGYPVDPQVGSAGFRIDLGVRNPDRPGQYILAIECDGATYHRALWARERDRLRQEVLEGLGWRFHRIWSTDWFQRRVHEIERLKKELGKARALASGGLDVEGSNASTSVDRGNRDVAPSPTDGADIVELEPAEMSAPPYRMAQFKKSSRRDPHEIPPSVLSEFAARIVKIEGPVHTDEVARRIANGFGKSHAGSRIIASVLKGLKHAKRNGLIKSQSSFWFITAQEENVPVRDRGSEGFPTNKVKYISDMEIRAAAVLIERQSGSVDDDDMIRSIARLLGFKRVGPDIRARIRAALRHT